MWFGTSAVGITITGESGRPARAANFCVITGLRIQPPCRTSQPLGDDATSCANEDAATARDIRRIRHWSWLADGFLLFAFATVLVRPLYKGEYLDAWASIESTFISDARFLTAHWPHPGWQPNWYLGTRTDYIYPPALRYGTAELSRIRHASTARSYHLYIALMYAFGIVAVYCFVRTGSGSRWLAIWAAFASAMISPSFLFFQDF